MIAVRFCDGVHGPFSIEPTITTSLSGIFICGPLARTINPPLPSELARYGTVTLQLPLPEIVSVVAIPFCRRKPHASPFNIICVGLVSSSPAVMHAVAIKTLIDRIIENNARPDDARHDFVFCFPLQVSSCCIFSPSVGCRNNLANADNNPNENIWPRNCTCQISQILSV